MAYLSELREFVIDNFLFGDEDDLTEETALLESGIIDSTGILEMVTFLEDKFGITIADEELVPENFTSLLSINHYLELKCNGGQN